MTEPKPNVGPRTWKEGLFVKVVVNLARISTLGGLVLLERYLKNRSIQRDVAEGLAEKIISQGRNDRD